MRLQKNRIIAIFVATLLLTSICASMAIIPSAKAHSPAWTIQSFAYLTVAPGVVGVNQPMQIYMWVDHALPGASESYGGGNQVGADQSGGTNGIRRVNYQLTITDPNGKVTTQTWPIVSDPTGIQYYSFTPTIVGNYTFSFYYPAQVYTWTSSTPGASTAYTNDTFTASTSQTKTVMVQQNPLPVAWTPSLPTAFWTYPIFGTNWNWYTIASNWLAGPYTPTFGSHSGYIQTDGAGPTTSHVMWSYPIQYGGISGGQETNVPGEAWYQGGSYNIRFSSAIIMQGTLFFQLPFGETGTGGNYVAVDLKTGKQLWSINCSATGVSLVPSFGYVYSMDQPNQHGELPDGALIASTTAYTGLGTVWRFYDPMTGVLTPMNVTNVPGGSNLGGPNGEYLKYILTNYGTSTSPNWYLAEWNSSKVFGYYSGTGTAGWYTGTENASNPSAYDWNVSVKLGVGTWAIGAGPLIALNNICLVTQGSLSDRSSGVMDGENITAISLQPNSIGNILWAKNYPPAPENMTRVLASWDPNTGVFIMWDQEGMDQIGYSLATGNQIWGPVTVPNGPNTDWNYMGDSSSQENVAYGNLYWASYTGQLYCFNDTTGNLEWTYGNGNTADNSTANPWLPYGYTPLIIGTIAGGIVYTTSSEHSPNSPLYANYDIRAINATTGLQIWSIPSFANLMYGGYDPVASGYLVSDNTYDQQIYCYGQGPSQTTVTAPDTATTVGTPIVIRGTVTDVSAGTQQTEQAADFPNGVPAVSDESMSQWMQYVYQQQPKPDNVTGVTVQLSVTDANGNERPIGTATTDSSGTFNFAWTPDIPGLYTLTATFPGTNGYYGSSAETSFYATAPTTTAVPLPIAAQPPTETYIAIAAVAIIIVIAIIGAMIMLMLRRKS
jgi:hypothetical protein